MKKFLVTEDERKHIKSLYEQSTPITPEQIAEQIKQAVDNEDINLLKKAIKQIRDEKTRKLVASILKSPSIMAYVGEEMKTTSFWTGKQNSYAKSLVEIGNYLWKTLGSNEEGDGLSKIYRDHGGVFNIFPSKFNLGD